MPAGKRAAHMNNSNLPCVCLFSRRHPPTPCAGYYDQRKQQLDRNGPGWVYACVKFIVLLRSNGGAKFIWLERWEVCRRLIWPQISGSQEEWVVRKTRKRAGLGGGEQLRHTQTQTRRGQGKDTVSLRGRRRKRQNKGRGGRGQCRRELWKKHPVIYSLDGFKLLLLQQHPSCSWGNWNPSGVNIMQEFFSAMHYNNPSQKNNKPGTSNGMFSEIKRI